MKYGRKIIQDNECSTVVAANNLPKEWIWTIYKEDGSGCLSGPDKKRTFFSFDSWTGEYVHGESSFNVKKDWRNVRSNFDLEYIMSLGEDWVKRKVLEG